MLYQPRNYPPEFGARVAALVEEIYEDKHPMDLHVPDEASCVNYTQNDVYQGVICT